jgi:signal transduction histidine kinase
MKIKSVKSLNPCKSVIQTGYDIVKAHGGELKVETNEARTDEPFGRGEGLPAEQAGSTFTILLPIV